MLSRRILMEVFDNLPAALVIHLGVDADTAIEMAERCCIEISYDGVFETGGNERVIWIYVSNRVSDGNENYRLSFVDSVVPCKARTIEKLAPKRMGGDWQWERVAA